MRLAVPIRNQGRIVIPRAVREELDLEYGDLVELDLVPVDMEESDE